MSHEIFTTPEPKDALTPDEKLEYGMYDEEESDPDYCFDQLDFSGEVYGNRDI